MKDLDEDRMKYVWTDKSEKLYQILINIDSYEWRTRKEHSFVGYHPVYYTYISGVPTTYTYNDEERLTPIERAVYVDLISALEKRESAMKHLSTAYGAMFEFRNCISWEEFDNKTPTSGQLLGS